MWIEDGGIVLEIRPDKMDRYREIVAKIDISQDRKDDVIRSVANLLQALGTVREMIGRAVRSRKVSFCGCWRSSTKKRASPCSRPRRRIS